MRHSLEFSFWNQPTQGCFPALLFRGLGIDSGLPHFEGLEKKWAEWLRFVCLFVCLIDAAMERVSLLAS